MVRFCTFVCTRKLFFIDDLRRQQQQQTFEDLASKLFISRWWVEQTVVSICRWFNSFIDAFQCYGHRTLSAIWRRKFTRQIKQHLRSVKIGWENYSQMLPVSRQDWRMMQVDCTQTLFISTLLYLANVNIFHLLHLITNRSS